ncbi:Putative transposase, RpnA-like [Desulfonema limicola]|uniref:Transposase, RpnA-like n=1 Tax=Desulfonema limicola TaxID=45656 RepID=A0A975B763_9BACT|nr:Rpn family recombination-promoting nuclease/putative transposase [Desulfonema limicola]QTA80063.1 Putative transposase, RpnA-like [Desulfonema limicola]
MTKILSPKNDYVFKKLFTQDHEILADLINSVLELPENEKICSVTVRNPVILAEDISKKFIILDIHAADESGREYDIEMQVRKFETYPERALYYLCRIYAAQLKSGKDYSGLNPVIGIHFLDYELFPDNDDFYFNFMLRDIRYPDLKLTDDFNLHIFELPGVEAALKKKTHPGLEWLYFFNHVHEEEEDVMQKQYNNPMITKAYDILKTLSTDEEIRHRAKVREESMINEAIFMAGERKKGKEEGIKVGRKKGRKEQAENTARKMLARNMNIEDIAEFTGLDVKDIQKLNQDIEGKT